MSKKLKICVYAICRDEEGFVDRFMDSCKDADGVFVLDTGSKDSTVEKLRARGAIVQVKEYSRWKTLEEYYKLKAEGKSPWRFDEPRNISMQMVPEDTDVCVCIDLDEVLTEGWRKVIEDNWKEDTTSLRYLYAWSPERTFRYNKITARNGYVWRTPIHETIYPTDPTKEKIVWKDVLLVQHFPDNKKSRGQYLHLLELAVHEAPGCVRSSYYLGREYTYNHKWEEAIKQLKVYLTFPDTWSFERAEACLMVAQSYGHLGDPLKQEEWLLRACSEDSKQREPWVELAEFYRTKSRFLLSFAAAKHALTINHLPVSHLNRPDSWNHRPHDIASIGAYYSGFKEESYKHAVDALMKNPFDERLIKNCHVVQDTTPRYKQKTRGVNVLILSYAKTDHQRAMTERCIKSLVQSSPDIELHVVVIETNDKAKKFENFGSATMDTIFPCEPFNYNKFLNIGWARRGKYPAHTMILNNDVTVFSHDFVPALLEGMKRHSLQSASPVGLREQFYRKQNLDVEAYVGIDTNKEINGWCILFDNNILNNATFERFFPPTLKFYYQDNWYGRMLQKHGFRHGLVTAARALHLRQQSHNLVSEAELKSMTDEQQKVFEELWAKENPA